MKINWALIFLTITSLFVAISAIVSDPVAFLNTSVTDWLESLSSIAAIVIAFAAFVYLRKTYKETKKATKALHRQLEQTKAEMWPSKPIIDPKGKGVLSINYSLKWENAGLTPALKVKAILHLASDIDSLPDVSKVYSTLVASPSKIVGPSQSAVVQTLLEKDAHDSMAYKGGQQEDLIIYTACLYTTQFGESHFRECTYHATFPFLWEGLPGGQLDQTSIDIKQLGLRSGPVDIDEMRKLQKFD